jgi:hypothetical protein
MEAVERAAVRIVTAKTIDGLLARSRHSADLPGTRPANSGR